MKDADVFWHADNVGMMRFLLFERGFAPSDPHGSLKHFFGSFVNRVKVSRKQGKQCSEVGQTFCFKSGNWVSFFSSIFFSICVFSCSPFSTLSLGSLSLPFLTPRFSSLPCSSIFVPCLHSLLWFPALVPHSRCLIWFPTLVPAVVPALVPCFFHFLGSPCWFPVLAPRSLC